MSRLQSELRRLFLLPTAEMVGAPSEVSQVSQVRALVMDVAMPAPWRWLGRVWQGVQADAGLPAPAIAVNGRDGLQLWFSTAEAVSVEQAQAFLSALQSHYLADVAPERVRLWPARTGDHIDHAAAVPAQQGDAEAWSAFVATDLAPIFDDTPWLDIPPGDDGQAELLSGLRSMSQEAFQRIAQAPVRSQAPATSWPAESINPTASGPHAASDPRAFLLAVMNDGSVDLALRIEAAKALLQNGTP